MYLSAVVGPLLPSGSPAFFFFSPLVVPLFALIAAHARPACAPCSSLRYPCLAALCCQPLSRHFSPPHLLFAVTLRVPSVHFRPPSLPLPCFHPCVPPVCSTHAPFCCPYPFPCCRVAPSLCPLCCAAVLYPRALPSFPVSLPFGDAMGSWRGGGFTCGLDCRPAHGRVR